MSLIFKSSFLAAGGSCPACVRAWESSSGAFRWRCQRTSSNGFAARTETWQRSPRSSVFQGISLVSKDSFRSIVPCSRATSCATSDPASRPSSRGLRRRRLFRTPPLPSPPPGLQGVGRGSAGAHARRRRGGAAPAGSICLEPRLLCAGAGFPRDGLRLRPHVLRGVPGGGALRVATPATPASQ